MFVEQLRCADSSNETNYQPQPQQEQPPQEQSQPQPLCTRGWGTEIQKHKQTDRGTLQINLTDRAWGPVQSNCHNSAVDHTEK